jgi:hypothetical protein
MHALLAPVLAATALLSTSLVDRPGHDPAAPLHSAALAAAAPCVPLGAPPDVLDPCTFGRLQLASIGAEIASAQDAASTALQTLIEAEAQLLEQPGPASRAQLAAAEQALQVELRLLDCLLLSQMQLQDFLQAFCQQDLE